MPSVSKAQHNLMAAVAHSPEFAKKVGIKQSVGREFTAADKGKKFSKGGEMKKLFGGKETRGEELKEAKALKSGKISKSQYVAGEKSEGHGKGAAKTASAIKSGKISPSQYAKAETMKKGGNVKKMAFGGLPSQAAPQAAVGMANRPAMPTQAAPQVGMGMANRPAMPAQANMGGAQTGLARAGAMSGQTMPTTGRPMKKGGCTKMAKGGKANVKVDIASKKVAPTAPTMPGAPRGMTPPGSPMMGRAPAAMPQRPMGGVQMMAKGGSVSSASKRADGCAIRGKTRGTEVKMAKGGKTKKYC